MCDSDNVRFGGYLSDVILNHQPVTVGGERITLYLHTRLDIESALKIGWFVYGLRFAVSSGRVSRDQDDKIAGWGHTLLVLVSHSES